MKMQHGGVTELEPAAGNERAESPGRGSAEISQASEAVIQDLTISLIDTAVL